MIFSFPVDPARFPITQAFGEHPEIYARFGLDGHNGIDFGCPEGTPVACSAPGTVIKTGNDPSGYGFYVKIDHGKGYESLYAHLLPGFVHVVKGQKIKRGGLIAHSDNSGFSTGDHLHFEIRLNGKAVDPLPIMQTGLVLDQPPAQKPDDYKIDLPEIDQGQAATKVEVVAADGLRLRIAPRLNGTVVGLAHLGAKFDCLGAAGDWAAVIVYCHKDWLKKA